MKSGTRAHTVPKFYLRGFCDPESENQNHVDPYLWIGSLETGLISKRSPKNIGIKTGLYDGPGGFENPATSIESHLAKIESAAALSILGFVSGNAKNDNAVAS